MRHVACGLRGCLFALVLLAGFVAGCGFRPLYGKTDEGSTVASEELQTVRINPMPDRAGQKFHNLLRDRLNPQGQPLRPRYLLSISLSETKETLAIREDETATRANLTMNANFNLTDPSGKQSLLRGLSSSTNSYNIVDSQFATYVAEEDARERALRELSDDIRLRLSAFFVQRRPEYAPRSGPTARRYCGQGQGRS